MTKKVICAVLISALLVTPAIAALEDIDIDANGYNWNGMSMSEKNVFATLLYKQLGTDEQKYPQEDVIKKVDAYYLLARHKTADEQNQYLRIPIAVVIGRITDCEIEWE